MKSKFLNALFLIFLIASSAFAANSDPYPCADSAWTSYTEYRVYLGNNSMPHAGSYTIGYRFDVNGTLQETKRNNHGASAINNGIVFMWNQGGTVVAEYYGPGGFPYESTQELVCLQNADCSWPCYNKYLAYSPIYLPPDTTINFLNMGRPYANKPVSIAYPNSSGGFYGSDPVTTDSSGNAVFLPKIDTPIYGGSVVNNMGDYNMNILLSGGTSGTTVIVEKDRPAPTRWTSAPISGSSNINMTLYWESLTSIPGHNDYLFVLYDIEGNMAGYSYTSNNYMSITIAPGTPFYFQIMAFDTEDRLYADSNVWGIAAPASRAATVKPSGQLSVLRIEREQVQVDTAKGTTGDAFVQGTLDSNTKVMPSSRARSLNAPLSIKAENPKKERIELK